MPQHQTTNSLLSDSILQIMKPSNVYMIQHLAAHLSAPAPSNLDIRAALDSLIREGKVEVVGMFMRSASYRLRTGNAVERGKELTGYAASLAHSSVLAMLSRGK
jgi:hypothetical protein